MLTPLAEWTQGKWKIGFLTRCCQSERLSFHLKVSWGRTDNSLPYGSPPLFWGKLSHFCFKARSWDRSAEHEDILEVTLHDCLAALCYWHLRAFSGFTWGLVFQGEQGAGVVKFLLEMWKYSWDKCWACLQAKDVWGCAGGLSDVSLPMRDACQLSYNIKCSCTWGVDCIYHGAQEASGLTHFQVGLQF